MSLCVPDIYSIESCDRRMYGLCLLLLCVPEIHASMKEASSLPVHAATLVTIIGNTAYGVKSK